VSNRSFMGIPVEGDIYDRSREFVEQRPIEDLYDEFQAAFASGVKAITWNQYTPYFNDGDTCEFSVGEYYVTTSDAVAASWLQDEYPDAEDSDGDGSYYDYQKPWYSSYSKTEYPHPDGISIQDWPELSIQQGAYELAMLSTFGDHTQVVVTPTRVIQFEYDHE
jgi:hypothetical protein